ncbi:Glutaredoxin-2 [Marinomonas spartinae]|uniref:Glutaredoxin-2 n=1 Tax=Marinomonas spartinae TaxID=1792290 RepID=A0A1A8TAJ8_9GAMM|nr:glutaredoxin 2 [Marinomonas spartinae]SBS28532.1 Glutaredoxin-2 [Marinomonas spartinae]
MQLYQYDHCPNCVRADMVANYKALFHEKIYLLHGDDDECYALLKKQSSFKNRQLPIFKSDDNTIITDGLKIARYLDKIGNSEKPIRPSTKNITAHNILEEAELHINCLVFPRNILLGLPEFSSRQSRDEFRIKKESEIRRPFEKALEETQHHKKIVETALQRLPEQSLPSNHDHTISWDDVMLFPKLRNLTMVLNLQFPDHLRRYIDEVAQATSIHTYYHFEI